MHTPRSDILERVGNATTRVYLHLLRSADPSGWVRRTSRRRVSMGAGVSAPIASRAMQQLAEAGGIRIEQDDVSQHSIDVHVNPKGEGAVPLVRLGQGEYARDFGGDI